MAPSDDWWKTNHQLLETIHANQLIMLRMLSQLVQQENAIMVDLTNITKGVTDNTNVTQSVVALVNNLATIIKNTPNDATTQAALDQLATALAANDAAIAAAVTANTPAST